MIADRLPDLVDNLLRLAAGVTVQEEDDKGNERIYLKPPCRQSNEYLVNRIMGKPSDHAVVAIEERRIIVERRDRATGRFAGEPPPDPAKGEG